MGHHIPLSLGQHHKSSLAKKTVSTYPTLNVFISDCCFHTPFPGSPPTPVVMSQANRSPSYKSPNIANKAERFCTLATVMSDWSPAPPEHHSKVSVWATASQLGKALGALERSAYRLYHRDPARLHLHRPASAPVWGASSLLESPSALFSAHHRPAHRNSPNGSSEWLRSVAEVRRRW